MDPNSNLQEQLEIAKKVLADPNEDSYKLTRLAELVEALDGWLTMGGFLPERWNRQDTK